MSPPADATEPAPPPAQPTARKLKVRTGCITCKIRKVKCDEGKPHCKRCTDTGRKCDGYATDPARRPSSTAIVTRQRPPPMTTKSMPLSADASLLTSHIPDIEHHWILHFCHRTAPSLTGSADTIFWAQVLPQLSFSEPAIRHALLAVGSSHARLEAGVAPEKSQAVISQDFAVRHYSKAVAALRHHIFHGPGDAVTSLICCLLFVCFECLYGNRLLVLEHLRNGANILNSARFQDSDLHYVKQKLQEITSRIDQQAILVGRPISEGKQPLVILPHPQSPFPDLEEAKEYMDLITGSCLTFIRSLFEGTFNDDEQECSANAFKTNLQHQLELWKNRMDLLEHRYPSSWISDDPAAHLLRIRYYGCYIYLGACLSPHETSFDVYEPEFASISRYASLLLIAQTKRTPLASTPYQPKETPPSFVFSLDAGLIPAIFFTAIKCRSPSLRREAIDFLSKYPGREAMWETKVHARVAARAVEIEESGFRPPFSFDYVLDHRVHRTGLDAAPPDRSPPLSSPSFSSDSSAPGSTSASGLTSGTGNARPSGNGTRISAAGAAEAYGIPEKSRIRHISISDTMNEPAKSVKVVFGFAPSAPGEAWCTWEEELGY